MNDPARSIVDPGGRYTPGTCRFFERVALVVTRWRSPFTLGRTRDAIEIRFPTGHEDGADLVVIVTPEAMELRVPTIEWTEGSHGPAVSSVLWRRLEWGDGVIDEVALHGQLVALESAYMAGLRQCFHCGEKFIAARMSGKACHGCAEIFEGVVF